MIFSHKAEPFWPLVTSLKQKSNRRNPPPPPPPRPQPTENIVSKKTKKQKTRNINNNYNSKTIRNKKQELDQVLLRYMSLAINYSLCCVAVMLLCWILVYERLEPATGGRVAGFH